MLNPAELETERRVGDPAVVSSVALLPWLFLFVTLVADRLVDDPTAKAGKTLTMATFVGASALCILGPLTLVALIGAIALQQHNFRVGLWFTRVAATTATLFCTVLTVAFMSDAFGSSQLRDDWHPSYSPPATLLIVAPHFVVGLANAYVLVRLSKRGA
ncbi:hypothetical protein ABZ319_37970 [Nocardia sp. NPDC005978]|uniref:hypothetical protein n=1 Tax=Nocardia sp. NPDC005978 TaxID=3156725 RepID=UPI0033A6A9CD